MYPPEKHLRNEKLKALQEQAQQILDHLAEGDTHLRGVLIQTQNMLIDLAEALKEPEEPG